MSDEVRKTGEQGQGAAQGPAPQQHEAEMPMLAASAAARLTRDILTRVNGPHGGMPSTPLRAGALWRQVTRRLGVGGQQPQARGTILFTQPTRSSGSPLSSLPPVPHTDLVWRAVRHHTAQPEDTGGWEEPDWPAQPSAPRASQAQPVQAPQPVLPPAAPVEGVAEPPPFEPYETQEAQGPDASYVEARGAGPEPFEPPIQQAAPEQPVPLPSSGAETPVADIPVPTYTPPRVVRIEYEPGPAVMPPQPLASPRISVREAGHALHGDMSRHLHSELNREMVPTTDLLSRMSYTHEVRVVPAAPRPAAQQQPQAEMQVSTEPQAEASTEVAPVPPAAPSPLGVATGSEQAQARTIQPQEPVAALPPREPAALEMPHSAPPQVRRAGGQQAGGLAEPSPVEQRNIFGRFLDRVASALPVFEPVRRVFDGESRQAAPQAPQAPQPQQPPQAGVSYPPPQPTAEPAQSAAASQPLAPPPAAAQSAATPVQAAPAPAPAMQASREDARVEGPGQSTETGPQPSEAPAGSPPSQSEPTTEVGRAIAAPVTHAPATMAAEAQTAPVQRQQDATSTQAAAEIQREAARTDTGVRPAQTMEVGAGPVQSSAPQVSEQPASLPVQTGPDGERRETAFAPYVPAARPAPASDERDYTERPRGGLLDTLRSRLFGQTERTGPGSNSGPLEMPLARSTQAARQGGDDEPFASPTSYSPEPGSPRGGPDGGYPYSPESPVQSSPAAAQQGMPASPAQAPAQEQQPSGPGTPESAARPTTSSAARSESEQGPQVPAPAPLEQSPAATAAEGPYPTSAPVPSASQPPVAQTQPLPVERQTEQDVILAPGQVETGTGLHVPAASADAVAGSAAEPGMPGETPAQVGYVQEAGPQASGGSIPPSTVAGQATPVQAAQAGGLLSPPTTGQQAEASRPEQGRADGGFITRPYIPPSEQEAQTRGFFETLRSRLFGGERSSGPAPLDMPVARTPRQVPPGSDEEWIETQYEAEQSGQTWQPGPSSSPTTSIEQPTQQPQQAYPVPPTVQEQTPLAYAEYQQQAPSLPAQAESTQDIQPSVAQAEPTVSYPPVPEAAPPGIEVSAAYEPQVIQEQAPLEPAGQPSVGGEIGGPAEPGVAPVVELALESEQPSAYSTPTAEPGAAGPLASDEHAQAARDTERESVEEYDFEQAAEVISGLDSGTWAMLSDMAEEVMRAHAPLAFVHRVGGQGRGGSLLGRIMDGPNSIFQAAQRLGNMWTAQPSPAIPGASGLPSAPGVSFVNRTSSATPGTASEGAASQPAQAGGWTAGSPEVRPLSGFTAAPQSAEGAGIVRTDGPGLAGRIIDRQGLVPGVQVEAQMQGWTAGVTGSVQGATSGFAPLPQRSRPVPGETRSFAGGSRLLDAAPLGVVRPLARMSPSLGASIGEEEDPGVAEAAHWSEVLQQLYGRDAFSGDMPLANPYGAFAVMSVPESGPGVADLSGMPGGFPSFAGDGVGGLESGFSSFDFGAADRASNLYVPHHHSVPAPPEEYSPVGAITNYSWGQAGDGADQSGDTGAWANVISQAVGSPQAAAAPALAMSGEERGPAQDDQPHEESESSKGPDLDELAETIYSIIKSKLEIERERHW